MKTQSNIEAITESDTESDAIQIKHKKSKEHIQECDILIFGSSQTETDDNNDEIEAKTKEFVFDPKEELFFYENFQFTKQKMQIKW